MGSGTHRDVVDMESGMMGYVVTAARHSGLQRSLQTCQLEAVSCTCF